MKRMVKSFDRFLMESSFFNNLFSGKPKQKDIDWAMEEAEGADPAIAQVVRKLRGAYEHGSGTTVTYERESVELSSSEARDLFLKIVRGILKNGIASIRLGIKSYDGRDFMWVVSDRPYSW